MQIKTEQYVSLGGARIETFPAASVQWLREHLPWMIAARDCVIETSGSHGRELGDNDVVASGAKVVAVPWICWGC